MDKFRIFNWKKSWEFNFRVLGGNVLFGFLFFFMFRSYRRKELFKLIDGSILLEIMFGIFGIKLVYCLDKLYLKSYNFFLILIELKC